MGAKLDLSGPMSILTVVVPEMDLTGPITCFTCKRLYKVIKLVRNVPRIKLEVFFIHLFHSDSFQCNIQVRLKSQNYSLSIIGKHILQNKWRKWMTEAECAGVPK